MKGKKITEPIHCFYLVLKKTARRETNRDKDKERNRQKERQRNDTGSSTYFGEKKRKFQFSHKKRKPQI